LPIGGILSFALGAAISLTTSWVVVSRLERVGERLELSEGLLGLLAALAADLPEITSAITALAHHQQAVGASVVIGSNVFNLAALLGLSAVVAGRIRLQSRAITLDGVVAIAVAALTVVVVTGVVAPVTGLVVSLVILVSYGVLLWAGPQRIHRSRRGLPPRLTAWVSAAVAEEELELTDAVRPSPATAADVVVGLVSLVVVVAASAVMERGATAVAQHYAIAGVVVGGVVLAVVTSLPNAVAAVYLARRGRGAAVLSTALNSNNLNALLGLLLPAAVLGAVSASERASWVAVWYLGMTVLALALASAERGLARLPALLIIVAYVGFVAWLVAG
jgi:cation:H+ antiporter